MAEDAQELFTAGDGHIYVAPYGTALPSDIDDTLNAAFKEMGYLTEDGFRMTPNITTVDTYGWQSPSPLRTDVTQREVVLGLDFLQSNTDVFPLYFGGGSFVGTVYSAPSASDGIDERSLVADVFDGSRSWRFWYPKVVLASNREVAFQRSATSKWGMDLKVLQVAGSPLFGFDSGDDSEFPAYPS